MKKTIEDIVLESHPNMILRKKPSKQLTKLNSNIKMLLARIPFIDVAKEVRPAGIDLTHLVNKDDIDPKIYSDFMDRWFNYRKANLHVGDPIDAEFYDKILIFIDKA